MRDTIKKHEDFAITPDDLSGLSPYFIVRAKPAKYQDDARYGLIVTKRLLNMPLIVIVQKDCCANGFVNMTI